MQPDPRSNPEVQELQNETQSIVALAGTYAVTTAEDYTSAADDLKRVKGALARLEKIRKSMTQPLDVAKRAIMDFFREPEDKLARAENSIKRAMIGYQNEQDRIRREQQARADAEARKEQERLQARAAKAAGSGKVEKAVALEQQAAAVVAPVISTAPPKVIGVQTKSVWKFHVENPELVPREYLVVDETKIRKVVGALKGDTKIPGVRVWEDKQIAAGAA